MPAPPELPTEPEALLKEALQPPAGRERERVVLPLVLLLITFGTTTLAGFLLANTIGGGTVSFAQLLADPALIVLGLPFSLTLLTILLAHEMGHYLACRYYGIRATLPYVLPAPPIPFGTFGAVIRIKSPFATPRQLFDVGVAGPLAGMVFVVPAAAIGLALSTPLAGEPPAGSDFVVSFPLLFRVFVSRNFPHCPWMWDKFNRFS